jgi:hypothetical protein
MTLRKLACGVVVVAGALVFGAIFGPPGIGRAAGTAQPTNTALPTISGTPQEGQTLTASKGTWTDNPSSYAYLWSRCDENGNSCSTIAGANAGTYTLAHADVGHTLRVTVTATNKDGSAGASSAPTAPVRAAIVNGCPSGSGAIQVADLAPPARLWITPMGITPSVVTRSTGSIQLHFRVTACGARPVQGAIVFAVPIPYNQFGGRQVTTGADGTVNFTESRLPGFPADRRQELLVVLVRASKPGERILSGVSSRRAVSFRVSLR